MTIKISRRRLIGLSVISCQLSLSVALTACSDFDDYNKEAAFDSAESSMTIWENIASQPNLSQFADVLKKGGYDQELANSRFYTVWAPENGTFNYDSLMNVDNETLVYKFIKSHVANYNYTLRSQKYNERVHMLNEKSFTLAGDAGLFTFDDKQMTRTNVPSLNGVFHTMSGAVQFLPNIYENIFETAGVDSIADFYARYETSEIDTKRSVEGPIDEDGNQTYSDTVLVVSNTMTGRNYLNADLSNEDSSYTMLLPTNEAYVEAYNKIKKCFNYATTTQYWAFDQKTGIPSSATNRSVAAGLSDSLTRRMIYLNTVFNNNQKYNRWLQNVDDPDRSDTLYSTRNTKLSNGPEILSRTLGGAMKMSNGWTRVIDSLAIRPWETYNPELNVEIARSEYRPLVRAATAANRYLVNGVTGEYLFRYVDLTPASETSATEAYFYINGVRSTTYNVYMVMIPSTEDLVYVPESGIGRYHCAVVGATSPARSYKFNVTLNYANANGTVSSTSSPAVNFGTFTSDSLAIDTIFLGQVTFPVSYVNVNNCYPYIMVRSQRSTWNRSEWNTFDNRLRISDIILRPVEYDEYLKKEEE